MPKTVSLLDRLTAPRQSYLARLWSNEVLSQIGALCDGDIVNVSAWNDSDKAGAYYRSYFPQARSYSLTNYGGGKGALSEDIDLPCYHLDLEQPCPEELRGKFDVVFNHTTLEHVFEVFQAVETLCDLSSDAVLCVVPWVQRVHGPPDFMDYWRFTPYALEKLFARSGMTIAYQSATPYDNSAIYNVFLATRHPERWTQRLAGVQRTHNTGDRLFHNGIISRVYRKFIKR